MMVVKLYKNQYGFTMIEMLIAVALSLIVLSGVYQVFASQQNAFNIQDQVAEMQQNARVALDMMARDLRMAGYDPQQTDFAPIAAAALTSIQFYADIDGSGDNPPAGTAEDITFAYDTANFQITRQYGGGTAQPLAQNIGSLEFGYGLDVDGNGVIDEVGATANDDEWVFNYDSDGDGVPDTETIAATITALGGTGTISNYLRIIRISITARTAKEDSGYTNADTSYGGYRTRILTSNVKARNLGL